MKTETKFDVNNLVKHKFEVVPDGGIKAYEIMQIHSETCYAGTQVFYYCRVIMGKTIFGKQWEVAIGTFADSNNLIRFREDELVELPQAQVDKLLGVSV